MAMIINFPTALVPTEDAAPIFVLRYQSGEAFRGEMLVTVMMKYFSLTENTSHVDLTKPSLCEVK